MQIEKKYSIMIEMLYACVSFVRHTFNNYGRWRTIGRLIVGRYSDVMRAFCTPFAIA